MAAAGVRVELSCSVCREIYTDPVTLPCGHNYCLRCIEGTWDGEKRNFGEKPSCPECRRRYGKRPQLGINLTASLCATHVRVHSRAAEHVLTVPTALFGDRKCSAHRELLRYRCTEDGARVCVSCCLAGGHRGHRVELLNETPEKSFCFANNLSTNHHGFMCNRSCQKANCLL
uniref:RING-type domain-containing protein n=1 Tax=Xenopus tropicalis TaxID=8364 RepID=A0A1B8Y0K5_XENTR